MRLKSADRTLTVIAALLVTAGILIFFSASLSLLPKGSGALGSAIVSQVVLGLGGGLLALTAAYLTPLAYYRRYAHYAFGFALVLTIAVFLPVIGVSANGATRWLNFGITTFQPSELLKVGYILLIAAILAGGKNRGADLRYGIAPFVGISAVVALVLLLQPDTDTLAIMVAAGAAMMVTAGTRLREILIFVVVAGCMFALLLFMRPYLWERVETFLDPSRDPRGSGYQIQQSLIAVGSGDVWGRGFGQSVQKFTYLPEASSDSIFAVYAEEFGFVGSVVLVLGFLSFVLRSLWVAARSQDYFGGLVVVGIATLIGAQAFLNIAAMIGLVPVGGLPLPFVSDGGSALLVALGMVGIVLNVSRTVRV
jgi:cell division protein FtsW